MTVISPTITEKLQNMGKACFTASLTHGSLVAAITRYASTISLGSNSFSLHMTVISPTITEKLQNMVDKGVVIWKEKEFEPSEDTRLQYRLVQTLFPSI
jgi:hypothetical protein